MPIDPTKPVDGVPASKAELRSNLQAAKNGIEGGGAFDANEAISIDAATFGDSQDYFLVCEAANPITVTLGADVPFKRTLHVVQKGTGTVTVDDNGSTSTLLTDAGGYAFPAQYDSAVFRSLGSGEWVRVRSS